VSLGPPPVEFLRVTDLHAFYGESHILHGVDFRVNRGELVTLLGRNGSGRTTTLKAILGLTGRRTGSVMVNGSETIDRPSHKIVQLGIGYCPEERGIFSSLSAEENLTLLPLVGSRVCPAASSRCWRWRAFSASGPGCSSSTRSPRGWRR
jgi:branched-chain amino acid transport system ATP-binding protein